MALHRWESQAVDPDLTLIQRHIKVKGSASPYDGNLHYWSTRLSKHPLLNGVKGKLLKKQAGKCRWCGLLFHDEDVIEIDHITPKSQGGGEELSNKCALHRHCHDERHRKPVAGTSDKGQIIEELDASKGCMSYTTKELELFLDLLYGMYSNVYTLAELHQVMISDPFDRSETPRQIKLMDLTDWLEAVVS